MPTPRHPQLPTHAEITTFLQTFLPPSLTPETQAREVPFLYHTPRHPAYTPTRQLTSRVIFSITPTSGVYTSLSAPPHGYRDRVPVCFLHRPFNLDRRAVRHGSLVLASHKSFDEHLTVGWNAALAERLGLNIAGAVCLKGYKGDAERKIGLVARVVGRLRMEEMVGRIRGEFGGAGELFGGREDVEEQEVAVVAIMNAFHAEEVERVLQVVREAGWFSDAIDGQSVLYLTGAARELGLEAAKKVNMSTYCVGHRACEEWGIKYLARQTELRWPVLNVVTVLEEEEPPPPKVKHKAPEAIEEQNSQVSKGSTNVSCSTNSSL